MIRAKHEKRTFQDREGQREQTPLRIALVGPSGVGKTFSAFRLATGILRADPGPLFFINTEGRRGRSYASYFNYREITLTPPYNPLSYYDAVEHAVAQGAKCIVIDSMTHEHAGQGGVLDMHENELDRIAGTNWKKRHAVSMLAWQQGKAQRDALNDLVARIDPHVIMCFRAKSKLKQMPKKKKQQQNGDDRPKDDDESLIHMGWMAIAGDVYVFEMDLSLLLLPGADGVPTFRPDAPGEQITFKLPIQFRDIVKEGQQLTEEVGEALGRWAIAGAKAQPPAPTYQPKKTNKQLLFERAREKRANEADWNAWLPKLTPLQREALSEIEEELVAIKREHDPNLGPPPDEDGDELPDDDTFPGDRPSTLFDDPPR
jgi:AAA domain